ncbi:6-carboxytetrahydropterin synthase QueD [Acidobacteriota bacterium]
MYEIRVEEGFSAAHALPGYEGNCSRIHGHNWKVRVYLRSYELDDVGLVLDFRKVRKAVKELLKEFDHTLLNEHPEFKEKAPSSENLAAYLYRRFKSMIEDGRCLLHAVEVEENHGVAAIYYGES